jgi:hypothetical protein
MPRWSGSRPLKRWRYVGAYGPELQLCVGDARIGPLRQRFWALATPDGRIREKTAVFGAGGVRMDGAEIAIDAPGVRARLRVEDAQPVETLSRHGGSYIWTRKQGGARVSGLVEIDGAPHQFEARGMVDESAGYHARHTVWSWSAGVGRTSDGRAVAWNLVAGVHDAAENSERTVWIEGVPSEMQRVEFAEDLSSITGPGLDLTFDAWAERKDETNALLLRSRYRQPFGTFKGTLAAGLELADGYGVTEAHDVHW